MKIVQILSLPGLGLSLSQQKIYLYLGKVFLRLLILSLPILRVVTNLPKGFITHLKNLKIFHLWKIKNALFSN